MQFVLARVEIVEEPLGVKSAARAGHGHQDSHGQSVSSKFQVQSAKFTKAQNSTAEYAEYAKAFNFGLDLRLCSRRFLFVCSVAVNSF